MFEALKNYLYSREWQDYVESFIHANCEKFKNSNSEEFTHEQYAIWKNFHEIAEQILEAALSEVNGTEFGTGLQALEKELDRISVLPGKGPRDAHMKEVLGQLLTFDCYQTFALMMSQAAQELYPDEEEESEAKWRDEKSSRSESKLDSPKYLNDLIAMGFSEELSRVVLENCPDEPLHQLVALLSDMQEGNTDNVNRKDGKLISSTSIPNEERNDDEFGDNDSVEGEDVEDHDIENEEHIEIFCKNEKFDYNDISTKRALAYSVVDAIKSGSVIRNNLELYKWACRMIEFDNELQSCYLFHRLSRTSPHSIPFRDWPITGKFGNKTNLVDLYDELERDRKESSERGEVGNICSEKELQRMIELKRIAAMGTSDEQLMHTLISRHEEIVEDLKNHYRSCELLCNGDGINTGIDRIQLEEMYLFLKENVMSGETIDVVSEKVYRYMQQLDPSGKNTSAVNVLLDMHLLEDEQIILKTRINALLRDPSDLSHHENLDTEVILSSNARPLLTSKAEFKDSPKSRPSRKEAFQSEKYQPTPSEYEERAKDEKASTNSSMDHLKEKLKEDHRKGLNRLKASLQSVRAMKIGALHQKKNYESEEELMNTLERLKTELDQQEKGIIAGYKQRCISETRAIKKKFHDGTGSLENLNLDENEKNLAAQIAAKSLRDKFELESKKLLEDQQYSRKKRKEDMMERLRRRQQSRGETDIIDEELEQEAEKIIQLQDEKEYLTILRPFLTSMIASKVFDPSLLSSLSNENETGTESETNTLNKWITETVNTSTNYQSVGNHLLNSLLQNPDLHENHKDGEEILSKMVGELLSKAYLAELSTNSSNTSIDLSDHYQRIKRNILKEYKRMKEESENELDYHQQKAQDHLKQRLKNKSRENRTEGGVTLPQLTEALNSFEQSARVQSLPDTKWIDEQLQASYQDESSSLLLKHEKHHSHLINTLETQMNERKKKLQERLHAIKVAKAADETRKESVPKNETLLQQQDEEITRLEQLQRRYDEFMIFLQSSDPHDLEKIGLNELLRQMDRPTRSFHVSDRELSNSTTPIPTSLHPPPAILPPIDDYTVDSEAIRFAARAAADLKRTTFNEYKESIEEEAKKISSVYREVQQKHDIAMRLEQARQSQNLQRKLLQKKKTGTS